MSAVTYLQRALLMHDLATLNGDEWEACFRKVLFPLMNKLLECATDIDPSGLDETKTTVTKLDLLNSKHKTRFIIFCNYIEKCHKCFHLYVYFH